MWVFKRVINWVEDRLPLSEVLSFITLFGLAYYPIDTEKKAGDALKEVLKKPIPSYAKWPYILGILTFILFIFQVVTGFFLLFYYQPNIDNAYESTRFIVRDVPLGFYIHQMHYWGSILLIVILIVRLIRFFYHRVYSSSKELHWILGLFLFFFAVQSAITGNVLAWDQTSFWSTTRTFEILREIPVLGFILSFFLGGFKVTQATLSRFYVLHIMTIPLFFLFLFYLHFQSVRKVGLSSLPPTSSGSPLYPDYILDLSIILFFLFGVLLSLSVFFPDKILEKADPFVTPVPIHPPFYLLPAYGLLYILPHWLVGWLIFFGILFLFALPFVDRGLEKPLYSRPIAFSIFSLLVVITVILGYIGFSKG